MTPIVILCCLLGLQGLVAGANYVGADNAAHAGALAGQLGHDPKTGRARTRLPGWSTSRVEVSDSRRGRVRVRLKPRSIFPALSGAARRELRARGTRSNDRGDRGTLRRARASHPRRDRAVAAGDRACSWSTRVARRAPGRRADAARRALGAGRRRATSRSIASIRSGRGCVRARLAVRRRRERPESTAALCVRSSASDSMARALRLIGVGDVERVPRCAMRLDESMAGVAPPWRTARERSRLGR